jgi:hypothetical protein
MLILYVAMNTWQMKISIQRRNVIKELFRLMRDIIMLGGVSEIFV